MICGGDNTRKLRFGCGSKIQSKVEERIKKTWSLMKGL